MASPSSLGNRRARRGSVSQNITHTAVSFMSSNGVSPFPLPLLFILILFLFLFLLTSSSHTHTLSVVATLRCCSLPVCAILKKTTTCCHQPFYPLTSWPYTTILASQRDACTLSFISHHIHGRGAQAQSNTENSIKSTDTDSACCCSEWEFGLGGALG